MEIATSKSQLNALLTALHLDFVCGDAAEAQEQSLKNFLIDLKKDRKDILKQLNINEKYATRLYRFVEWCDAFSLLICMDKIQAEGRKMEVSESPDGDMSQTFYKAKNEITVEPWVLKVIVLPFFMNIKLLSNCSLNQ